MLRDGERTSLTSQILHSQPYQRVGHMRQPIWSVSIRTSPDPKVPRNEGDDVKTMPSNGNGDIPQL